jgi:hypothetical protein
MRILFRLMLLLLLLGGGFVLAYRSGLIGGGADERVIVEVSPEAAASAERKLERLTSNQRTAHLTEVEITSLLRYRPQVWGLPGGAPPVVTMRADTLHVSGTIPTNGLPSDPSLDAIRLLLPDSAHVGISGTVSALDDRTLAFSIAALEVEGMPFPPRYVPAILDRMGFPKRDDLASDAIAIPLPAGISTAEVADGELVLTP